MNYPVFIFHELVLRFWYINKQIGRYISNSFEDGQCLIRTSSGWITIDEHLLDTQYHDPSEISDEQLRALIGTFQSA